MRWKQNYCPQLVISFVSISQHAYIIFAPLHGMQTRSSDVRPSVCLSGKRVNWDKTEEKSVQIFLYHTKDHLA